MHEAQNPLKFVQALSPRPETTKVDSSGAKLIMRRHGRIAAPEAAGGLAIAKSTAKCGDARGLEGTGGPWDFSKLLISRVTSVGSNPTLSAIFAVVVARIGFSATTSRESRQGRKAAAAAMMSGAGVSADTGYLLLRLRRTFLGDSRGANPRSVAARGRAGKKQIDGIHGSGANLASQEVC
jgi:hypothetical protein